MALNANPMVEIKDFLELFENFKKPDNLAIKEKVLMNNFMHNT